MPDEYLRSKPFYTKLRLRPTNAVRRSSSSASQSQSSFGDALDASRGMLAMSQDLTTPRNIYGPRSDADSTDSYGFPSSHSSSHSSHSSISSASTYPSYYSSSVDGSSVSDYSSQSDSMESISSRTLPRPSGLINSSLPPAPPQSMMGQFNSKISLSTQKKHKCKVCDKRFTRPSSLQTHMYSHTGEKRMSLHSTRFRQWLICCQHMRAKPMAVVDIFPLYQTYDVIAKYIKAIDLRTMVHQKDHGCPKNLQRPSSVCFIA